MTPHLPDVSVCLRACVLVPVTVPIPVPAPAPAPAHTSVLPRVQNGTVAFVGSHLDVVPANPEDWEVPPFKLTRRNEKQVEQPDGDRLYVPTVSFLIYFYFCFDSVAVRAIPFTRIAFDSVTRGVWRVACGV